MGRDASVGTCCLLSFTVSLRGLSCPQNKNSRDLSWETLRYDWLVIEIMRKVAGLANHRLSHFSIYNHILRHTCLRQKVFLFYGLGLRPDPDANADAADASRAAVECDGYHAPPRGEGLKTRRRRRILAARRGAASPTSHSKNRARAPNVVRTVKVFVRDRIVYRTSKTQNTFLHNKTIVESNS